jgi:hypothetical protein
MSDIFDGVDDILNEVDAEMSGGGSSNEEADNNFNESELQDIMAEIESLEQEFEVSEAPVAEIVTPKKMVAEHREAKVVEKPKVVALAEPIKKTELQMEIDDELEKSLREREESETPKAHTSEIPLARIHNADTETCAPIKAKMNSEISLEAVGQMSLNLGFKIGTENATLVIDPARGLSVTMSGVELVLNHEEGCKVTMANGVKFTIPLTSPESAIKKKSA